MAASIRTTMALARSCRLFQLSNPAARAIVRCASRHKGCNKKKFSQKSEKYFGKLLHGSSGQPKTKKWYSSAEPSPTSAGGATFTISEGSRRRAAHLNIYLMENIANAFYQGEVCSELNEYNFSLRKVKISPDMNNLTIYWNSSGSTERDEQVEALLEQNKGHLRSILTHKNLIGRIPPISFVMDSSDSRMELIENLLKKADMGPDYVPTDIATDLKALPNLTKSMKWDFPRTFENTESLGYNFRHGPGGSREILLQKETENIDWGKPSSDFHSVESEDSEPQSEETPWYEEVKMRSDLYELDHSELYKRASNRKKKAGDRSFNVLSESTPTQDEKHVEKYLSKLQQRKKLDKIPKIISPQHQDTEPYIPESDFDHEGLNADEDDHDVIDDYENKL